MIKPWVKLSSKPLADFRIFTVRSDLKRSPRTGEAHEFYVIDTVNWVNVVARTPAGELVMCEQYRHGSNTVELELPGGMIDAADASPEAAALRELREETGYEGASPNIIGQVYPNPAIMSNVCFTVFVDNCRCVSPVDLDQAEDLVTRLVPARDIPKLVAEGKIRHALIIAALYQFELSGRA